MLHGVAFADTNSKGTYSLTAGTRSPTHSTRGLLPSCGRTADEFVGNVSKVDISYRDKIYVNGKVWTLVESDKLTLIIEKDSLKPLVVAIVFGRTGKGRAAGTLSVLGSYDGDEPRCGDTVNLAGTFVP